MQAPRPSVRKGLLQGATAVAPMPWRVCQAGEMIRALDHRQRRGPAAF
jgi:hypothetical protein